MTTILSLFVCFFYFDLIDFLWSNFGEFQRTRKSLGEHIGQAGRQDGSSRKKRCAVGKWAPRRSYHTMSSCTLGQNSIFCSILEFKWEFLLFYNQNLDFCAKIQLFQVLIKNEILNKNFIFAPVCVHTAAL